MLNKDVEDNLNNKDKKEQNKNNEIKKFTENQKDSSYVSSNSNSKPLEKHSINDHLLERKYWNEQKSQTEQQFTDKYKK